ncbi:MAG: hypothetical protein ACFFAU_07605 [Candidatus Hodarchaeota archaeon]
MKELDTPLAAYFTGGDTGMSVIFSVNDYKLLVKPTEGSQVIL